MVTTLPKILNRREVGLGILRGHRSDVELINVGVKAPYRSLELRFHGDV